MSALDTERLREVSLFSNLTPLELEEIATLLHRKSYSAGAGIITADQPGEVIYVIEEGTVKIELDQADGSQAILAILGPGDTVGEMSLVDHAPRSANVITLEPTTVLWMERAHFERCLGNMNLLSQSLARLLNERLRMANQQILALSTLDVAGRVGRQLLAFAHRYGRTNGEDGAICIPMRLTQSDIAGLVGASRERVNHVWGDLRERGLVASDSRHHITIRDREALADICMAA